MSRGLSPHATLVMRRLCMSHGKRLERPLNEGSYSFKAYHGANYMEQLVSESTVKSLERKGFIYQDIDDEYSMIYGSYVPTEKAMERFGNA